MTELHWAGLIVVSLIPSILFLGWRVLTTLLRELDAVQARVTGIDRELSRVESDVVTLLRRANQEFPAAKIDDRPALIRERSPHGEDWKWDYLQKAGEK